MARFDFRLPDIGEGVAEGEIVKWLVQPGQDVVEDQPLVEVMTDKATVVIGSPSAGRVKSLGAEAGATVAVGGTLAVLELEAQAGIRLVGAAEERSAGLESVGRFALQQSEEEAVAVESGVSALAVEYGSNSRANRRSSARRALEYGATRLASGDRGSNGDGATSLGACHAFATHVTTVASVAPSSARGSGAPGNTAAAACGDLRESLPGMGFDARVSPTDPASGNQMHPKPLATPATRKLARDLGIDLATVCATGRWGRVTSEDVRVAHAAAQRTVATAAPPPMLEALESAHGLEERVPLRGLRKRTFESMAQSSRTAAHCTLIEECEVSALKRMRERLKAPAAERGVKLSFLPFIVKAVVAALRRHPHLNASFDELTQEIVTRHYYNVGIAVATEAGLMVPVLKAADKMTLLETAGRIDALAEQARAHQLELDSLKGGTFTITSLGTMGGLLATPIIRLPEVAILGVHQIKQKPVVREGQIVIGEIMMVSLSFDHRLIDGHVAAAFVYDVVGALEEPERLLLE